MQTIRDRSEPEQWYYVDTALNPADYVSRGLTAIELVAKKDYYYAPEFVWKNEKPKQHDAEKYVVTEDDPEVKREHISNKTNTKEKVDWNKRFKEFSNWHSLCRGMELLIRVAREKVNRRDSTKTVSRKPGKKLYMRLTLKEVEAGKEC